MRALFFVFFGVAVACTTRNSSSDESLQSGVNKPANTTQCTLPTSAKKTLLFADPDFKEDCDLTDAQKTVLRKKKQDLVDAGIVAACSNPSQIPPSERQKLVEAGVVPSIQAENPAFARISAKVGGGVTIDPWFITAEQRKKLESQNVGVPTLAMDLDPETRADLIKQGALPRNNSPQERAQAQKFFFSQSEQGDAAFRFSTLTVAMFESKSYCEAFYKKRNL